MVVPSGPPRPPDRSPRTPGRVTPRLDPRTGSRPRTLPGLAPDGGTVCGVGDDERAAPGLPRSAPALGPARAAPRTPLPAPPARPGGDQCHLALRSAAAPSP
ncbi:hypothetical protein FNV65_39355 [Streptomyces sp. S1A1-8]|nr:hypothetical protein FNV66_39635 [Streptomyces sp. S1D4-14]QDO01491.1 hypothetical protein FNV58_40780 [Streptomyces sp. RLB1-9]QDO23222.1 hypothetical protein FNV65_39355 [Streptomyces sp. S1A1-8]QDO33348.1 hypothetical protein FNV63_39380 [Streptomyces sp. S1A1-3]